MFATSKNLLTIYVFVVSTRTVAKRCLESTLQRFLLNERQERDCYYTYPCFMSSSATVSSSLYHSFPKRSIKGSFKN